MWKNSLHTQWIDFNDDELIQRDPRNKKEDGRAKRKDKTKLNV